MRKILLIFILAVGIAFQVWLLTRSKALSPSDSVHASTTPRVTAHTDMPDAGATVTDSTVRIDHDKGPFDGDSKIVRTEQSEQIGEGLLSEADLATLLKSPDEETVLLAIRGLAALGTSDAVDRIIETLTATEEGEWRHRLAEPASCITNPAATKALFELVEGTNDSLVIDLAARSLAAMSGDMALLETVARYRLSSDEQARSALLAVVRYQARSNSIPLLSTLADQANNNYSEPLALAIVDTLGVIGTAEATADLLSRLPTATSEGPIVNAISRTANPDSISLLLTVANGSAIRYDQNARVAAVRALANFQTDDVNSTLKSLSNDVNASQILRSAALDSLRQSN